MLNMKCVCQVVVVAAVLGLPLVSHAQMSGKL
jgi:hypothetical protein